MTLEERLKEIERAMLYRDMDLPKAGEVIKETIAQVRKEREKRVEAEAEVRHRRLGCYPHLEDHVAVARAEIEAEDAE